MPTPAISNTEKDRAERAIYRALDAVQYLCDIGLGSSWTEEAFRNLRGLEHIVEEAPIRTRKPRSTQP